MRRSPGWSSVAFADAPVPRVWLEEMSVGHTAELQPRCLRLFLLFLWQRTPVLSFISSEADLAHGYNTLRTGPPHSQVRF